MKKIVLLPLVLLIAAMSVKGQVSDSKDQTEVKQAIADIFIGVSAFDLNKIKQHSTSDLLILETGKVWNLDSVANVISKQTTKPTAVNEFKFVSVQVNGKTAWVTYYNTAHVTAGDKKFDINWLESAVLVKRDVHWLISLIHSTKL